MDGSGRDDTQFLVSESMMMMMMMMRRRRRMRMRMMRDRHGRSGWTWRIGGVWMIRDDFWPRSRKRTSTYIGVGGF